MSGWIRHLSRRGAITLCVAVAMLPFAAWAVAGVAQGGHVVPPKRSLAYLVKHSQAPAVQGVSATITYQNHLLDSLSGVPGLPPLLSGATGRMWADQNHLRIELQGQAGDSQIIWNGQSLQIYDAASNSVYELAMSKDQKQSRRHHLANKKDHTGGSLLQGLQSAWNLGTPQPGNVAGQPSYTVRADLKDQAGLLSAVQISWDATYHLPLSFQVYAKNVADPVLDIHADQADFVQPDASAFNWSAPADAKHMSLGGSKALGAKALPKENVHKVNSPVSFHKLIPANLLGRQLVRSTTKYGRVISMYGDHMDALTVVQLDPKTIQNSMISSLPSVDTNLGKAHVLQTALGGILLVDAADSQVMILGSVSQDTLVSAANALGG